MPIGSLSAGTGKTMRFTGITVLKVENGLITEEISLDDGVTVLQTTRPHQGGVTDLQPSDAPGPAGWSPHQQAVAELDEPAAAC